jgi:excisionase family DNA binding protein
VARVGLDPCGMEAEEVLTVGEAARRLGVSRSRVSQLVNIGRLERVPTGITAASVSKYAAERAAHQAGTPTPEARAYARVAPWLPRGSLERAVLRAMDLGLGVDPAAAATGVSPGTVADALRWIAIQGVPGAAPEPPPAVAGT